MRAARSSRHGGTTPTPRGRPPSASREQVLREVRAQYLRGERVDVTEVARRLGVGRATIYRWFGSRELLLGEVIATELETLVAGKRASTSERGAAGLMAVFDAVNRSLARSPVLARLFEQEPGAALRVLTSGAGVVQPRAVACIERLISDEVDAGRYRAPAAPSTLAYAIVRLAEAFLYNDATIGVRGDHERLREVEAALLGVTGHRDGPGARAP